MGIWTRSGCCVILGIGGVKLLCIVQVGFWVEPYAKASDLVCRGESERLSTIVSTDIATLDSQCHYIEL